MTHVFVTPHPNDGALWCGGLIAGLRELGQQPMSPGDAERHWISTTP